jgi:hypothetical protein
MEDNNIQGTVNTAVSGVFEKADQVVEKLKQSRRMILDALEAAEQGQPLGARTYDELKDCLLPVLVTLAQAVNFVSGEQRYVDVTAPGSTTAGTAEDNAGIPNVIPPSHIYSALTPEMLNQITTYIQTVRDGLEKHGKTAYNTIGPSYEQNYQEYERLAADARQALNALLKFWQGVEPRIGIPT